MNDYRIKRKTYTWTKTGAATALDPDSGAMAFDIMGAEEIRVQIDTTHASHTSSSFDLNVFIGVDDESASPEVPKYDTVASQNIAAFGDNLIQTYRLEDSNNKALMGDKLRIQADNNNNNALAKVTVWAYKRVL